MVVTSKRPWTRLHFLRGNDMSIYLRAIIIAVLIVFLQAKVFASERVAVIDFQAKGINQIIAKNVSELIRAELISSGKYTVIERAQMAEILKEQEFQMTGCTDVSCAVKVGKLLSARKILVGTVMQMGVKIIISGRIVDVERGVGEEAANQDAQSTNELDTAVRMFVAKLSGSNVTHDGTTSTKGKTYFRVPRRPLKD